MNDLAEQISPLSVLANIVTISNQSIIVHNVVIQYIFMTERGIQENILAY